MSLLFKRELSALLDDARARRLPGLAVPPTRDESMAADVKWACLRLRGDLVSTTPLDVFRERDGLLYEVPKPQVLVTPDGRDITDWLYSSQTDLDDVGNDFGVITERDRAGFPSRIELVPAERITVRVVKGVVSYLMDGQEVPADQVWHERQFSTPGQVMGLSPTAYAAYMLSGYLSAVEFARDWFAGNAIPAAHLRNTAKVLNKPEARKVKADFIETITTGDVFVTGSDWEYSVLGAKASESAFIDMLKVSAPAQCRFYGVPGDVVDVESATGNITYANVTQRNLQLLTLNMGPAFVRRERAFTNALVPRGQVVKFATDAMLRMDPQARGESMGTAIESRRMTVTEARALDNRPPLTREQEAEFARLFPTRAQTQGVNP
ncbi:MAG: phage portal protein [Candidatus Nanopelagicales bacterium]